MYRYTVCGDGTYRNTVFLRGVECIHIHCFWGSDIVSGGLMYRHTLSGGWTYRYAVCGGVRHRMKYLRAQCIDICYFWWRSDV